MHTFLACGPSSDVTTKRKALIFRRSYCVAYIKFSPVSFCSHIWRRPTGQNIVCILLYKTLLYVIRNVVFALWSNLHTYVVCSCSHLSLLMISCDCSRCRLSLIYLLLVSVCLSVSLSLPPSPPPPSLSLSLSPSLTVQSTWLHWYPAVYTYMYLYTCTSTPLCQLW